MVSVHEGVVMGRRARWASAGLVGFALVAAACSGSASHVEAKAPRSTTTTTVGEASSTTSTPATVAPSTTAVPSPTTAAAVAAPTTVAPTPTTKKKPPTVAPAAVPAPTAAPAPAPKITGTITVYAAASLTNAFAEMGKAFEQTYPDTSVKFNFAGSSTLVTQIFQGAPADVFASADSPNMDRLVSSGLMAGGPQIFTKNLLQIVVGKNNPKSITGLADLARSDVVTILCAPAVPCGNYARQALANAGVTVTPKSNEANVTALVGRIASGEADAGIGYVTDVLADSRVSGVTIPANQNIVAEYPLAVLHDAPNAATAQPFVDFVRSSTGQQILGKYGFLSL